MESKKKRSKIEVRVTEEEKQKIKVLAELSGKTMSEYFLSKAFEDRNMKDLILLLEKRNKEQKKINCLQLKIEEIDAKIMDIAATIIEKK